MTNPQPGPLQDPETLKKRIAMLRDNGLTEQADKMQLQYDKVMSVPPSTTEWLSKYVTQSPEMLRIKESVALLARVKDSVLIEGPTGTGKEILANALHGDRGKENFIPVNCAGLPEHLIESELFGHMKGSFTGANDTYPGLLKMAGTGTVFLDEVGELPLSVQAKLLRVLQENMVRKVGSHKSEAIQCRFISATHRKLDKMVERGEFREDLFYRLNTFHLRLLPLMERSVDIPLLLDHIADQYERENNIPPSKKFPRNYPLRMSTELLGGNVRSLQQIVRRFHVLGILPDTIK